MMRCSALLLVLAACGGPDAMPEAASQEPQASTPMDEVLGTIEATVDGQPMTWYIVSGDVRGAPYASAVWYRPDDESVLIGIGGFDTQTPPMETFETGEDGTPVSYGDYSGPVFTLTFETGSDPAPYRRTFPDDGMTSLVYMSQATMSDIDFMFIPQSGEVDVTVLELSNGRIRAEGTFSGRLGNVGGEGRFVEVTDGRFSVRGVPHLDEISGE